MPIVPIVLGGVAVATTLGGLIAGARGGLKLRKAKKQYDERVEQYKAKEAELQEGNDTINQHLTEAGAVRIEAIVILRSMAEYLQKAKVKDRDLNPEEMDFIQEELERWENKYFEPLKIGYGVAMSAISGAGTATLANTLAVSIGIASTGTAISTLSGAAATNAALAWLGGGALAVGGGGMALGTLVLGGITLGPGLLIGGVLLDKSAIKKQTELEAEIAKIEIAEAEMHHQLAEFVIIHKCIDEMIKAQQEGSGAVRQMTDALEAQYPDGDAPIEAIHKLVRTGVNLGTLIDIRILDDDGNFIQEGNDDRTHN